MQRRNKSRYPLSLDVELHIGDYSFHAVTRDIASNGAFITTPVKPIRGQYINLRLEWPVLLNDRLLLVLTAKARVERVEHDGFAVSFVNAQFKTAGRPVERSTPVVQSLAS